MPYTAAAQFSAGAGSWSVQLPRKADAPFDPKAFLGAVDHNRTVAKYRKGDVISRKLGFIEYNGTPMVNSSLLSAVLRE
jgi:hypothetical protein